MDIFDLFAKIKIDSSEYEKGIAKARGESKSFGDYVKSGISKLGSLITTVTREATTKVAGLIKSSIDTGMNFDKAMAGVAATLGKSVDEIQNLRDFAKQMGETTRYSAMEAAQGLNYMALAGYDAEKSMKMLPEVMKLASAGGMQLGYASDVVTDAQSALGLSLEQTSTLINQMAKTASSSNTSVSQLGEAILQIGGTAKDMKGGTLELATTLGILANNGIKGAEGGTALRNILNALIGTEEKAADALDSMNVSLFDSKGEMRDLNSVFSDMNKAMSKMTTQERKQMITTIFNARDLKSVEALLANTGEAWDDLMQKIKESEGAAGEMSKTQENTAAGAKSLMESALEGLKINLSEFFMPTVRSGYNFLSGFFSDMSATIKAFINNGTTGIKNMINILIGDAKRDFPKKVLGIFSSLDRIWIDVKDVGSHLLKKLIEPITSNAKEIGEGAIIFASNLANSFSNSNVLTTIGTAAIDIINGIGEGATSQESLSAFVSAGCKFLKSLANGIANFLAGSDGEGGLLGAAENIINNVGKWFENKDNRKYFEDNAVKFLDALCKGTVAVLKATKDLLLDAAVAFLNVFLEDIDYDHGAEQFLSSLGKSIAKAASGAGIALTHGLSDMFGGFVPEFAIEEAYQQPWITGSREEFQKEWDKRVSQAGTLLGKSGLYAEEAAYDYFMHPDDNELKRALEANSSAAFAGIPRYGDGTIVSKPTLAMIGERGEPEAVVPLGHETETSRALGFGGGVVIQFGDIYVSGVQDAGNEVIRNIDEALREWQLRQKRGIGGVAWQP